MAELIEQQDQADQDLEYVRAKRKEIIEKLLSKGIPDDVKETAIVAGMLADMDRVALGKKRLKADDKLSNSQTQAAEMIANLFANHNVKELKFSASIRTETPVLSDDFVIHDIVPGELDLVPIHEDYNSFMNRVVAEQ